MRNKILCFVLTLCMFLPLCGCGANLDEKVVGTWDYYYTSDSDEGYDYMGDKMRATLEIYKGGTGEYTIYDITKDKQTNHYPIKWETADGVLNVTYLLGAVIGHEYDDESDTLHSFDDSKTFIRR